MRPKQPRYWFISFFILVILAYMYLHVNMYIYTCVWCHFIYLSQSGVENWRTIIQCFTSSGLSVDCECTWMVYVHNTYTHALITCGINLYMCTYIIMNVCFTSCLHTFLQWFEPWFGTEIKINMGESSSQTQESYGGQYTLSHTNIII